MLEVSVRPRQLLTTLLTIVAALSSVSYALLLATAVGGLEWGFLVSARKFFDVNAETNLPSFFSTVLLSVVGLVTFEHGRQSWTSRRRWSRHWMVLGAGFCYLALDELVGLHERLVEPMTAVVGDDGVFRYAWVAAALPAALVVGLLYTRFLWSLPRWATRLALLGAALYVGGAVGLEMVANVLSAAGWHEDGWALGTLQALEEACEMTGPAVFLYVVARLQLGDRVRLEQSQLAAGNRRASAR